MSENPRQLNLCTYGDPEFHLRSLKGIKHSLILNIPYWTTKHRFSKLKVWDINELKHLIILLCLKWWRELNRIFFKLFYYSVCVCLRARSLLVSHWDGRTSRRAFWGDWRQTDWSGSVFHPFFPNFLVLILTSSSQSKVSLETWIVNEMKREVFFSRLIKWWHFGKKEVCFNTTFKVKWKEFFCCVFSNGFDVMKMNTFEISVAFPQVKSEVPIFDGSWSLRILVTDLQVNKCLVFLKTCFVIVPLLEQLIVGL